MARQKGKSYYGYNFVFSKPYSSIPCLRTLVRPSKAVLSGSSNNGDLYLLTFVGIFLIFAVRFA